MHKMFNKLPNKIIANKIKFKLLNLLEADDDLNDLDSVISDISKEDNKKSTDESNTDVNDEQPDSISNNEPSTDNFSSSSDDSFDGGSSEVEVNKGSLNENKKKIYLINQYEELLNYVNSYIDILDELISNYEKENYDALVNIKTELISIKSKIENIIFINFKKEKIFILIKDFYLLKNLFFSIIKDIKNIIDKK